ncbi:ATP-binding protein [Streptomyces sp. NPDC050856]|uniref:ATP-binding protein n=1 Tax=Streptomyces sp. NPDC050856 TaxID=3154939 RepID=UPI0033C4CBCD
MSIGRSDLREIFATRLREELRAGDDDSPAVSETRRAYRQAACLLTRFDPLLLRLPGEGHPKGGAVLELLDDCVAVGGAGRATWTLRSEVREEALRSLAGPHAALRALADNAALFGGEPGPERACLAYLSGHPPRPEGRSADELTDILQAVLWLSCVPGVSGLPATEELQRELERARLFEPLERLVGGPFQGRDRELARLREYAGLSEGRAPPPGPAPPLVVHGPGGIGKSTLLAAFLLGSVRRPEQGFPFAYVDFERPTLSVHEPATLIGEAARQLGVQYPAYHAELDVLAQECQRAARLEREDEERVAQLHRLATTRATVGRGSSREMQALATERETDLFRRVADVLLRAVSAAGRADTPFVLVLDSFEAAQYRGSPALGRLWAMFLAFRNVYPRLRVLVSGRAPVGHPAQPMASLDLELGELDREAAVALLEACGVADPGVARALAGRVGGHPLSLRLAARAAALAGKDPGRTGALIDDLPERRDEFFHQVDQMLVQGILYDRILHHITDERVRRLAHPGLVLRIITPEIIKDVLAAPCGLRVGTPEEARALFDELAGLDLVEPYRPGTVRHRKDVRAIMLRLTGGDRGALTREVERRAVQYYAAREGVEARAEEIYHRLRLEEDPRAVEERWLPGVERFLAGAEREMGPRAAALLTARLGTGAQERVMAGADQEDWERMAAREVEDLLAQGLADAALTRLAERRPWTPCSALHALLAETLDRLGRLEEARRVVAAATGPAERAGCAHRHLELLLLSARLAREAGDLAGAERDLRAAEDLAVRAGLELEAVGALLARARLLPRADAAGPPGGDAGTRLVRRLRLLPGSVLADQPVLVRAVASQMHTRYPGVLDEALDVVGLPAGEEAPRVLGAAICRAVSREPALLGPVMEVLRQEAAPGRRPGTAPPSGITGILRLAHAHGSLDALARRLLEVPDDSGEIAAGVAEAMGLGSGGDMPGGAAEHSAARPRAEGNGPS